MKRKPRIDTAVYTVPEVASLLDINLTKAYALAKQDGFPAIRLGKRFIVPKVAFERWLEQAAFDSQSSEVAEK